MVVNSATGGYATNFEAYQIKGTVTVGGSTASSFTATGTSNVHTGIQIGNIPGCATTFNVANATGDSAVDLTIANRLLDGNDTAPNGSALVKDWPRHAATHRPQCLLRRHHGHRRVLSVSR